MIVFIKKDKFEELLARKNLTQADVAKVARISPAYLSTLKDPDKYKAGPSPEVRGRLLKLLGCRFDDIFFVHHYRYSDKNIGGGL